MHVGADEWAARLKRGVSDVSQLNFTEQDKGKSVVLPAGCKLEYCM